MVEQYKYDFSVVMAVYNVEKYLREAVDSLIHQTIGFSHIQVILVDDGSTDKSGSICDEYKKKYPENVIVIHKENGRQASARNAGLPYAEGKYVNFLDPDDTLERHAMKRVKKFMDQHSATDVCCIPMVFFGNMKGPHMLNDKFSHGTCVVDLLDNEFADCKLMSVSASFYRNKAAKKMTFDTRLFHAEDAKENLRLLIDNPVLGLVTGTQYNYRKHGASTLDASLRRKETYIPYLKYFSLWAIEEAKEKYQYVPYFVQNTVMYDLQWKWNVSHIPTDVLSEPEIDQYKDYLVNVTSQIDDEIILSQKYLNTERKCLILDKKYGRDKRTLRRVTINNRLRRGALQGDIAFDYYGKQAIAVSEMDTILELLTITKNNCCEIEGYHHNYGLDDQQIRPIVIVNGRIIYAEMVQRPRNRYVSLGEMTSETIGFKCTFPINSKNTKIGIGLDIDGLIVPRNNLRYGRFFPVTGVYKNSYAIIGQKEVRLKGNFVCVCQKPIAAVHLMKEAQLISELWEKNLLGGRKAIVGRIFYYLAMPFKRRKIWIVSDRIMKADDNGEALFNYLMENKLNDTIIIFAISKQSSDYGRMKRIGRCVSAMSFRHKLLHLLCDVVVSSHADGVTRNPYHGHDDGLRDLLSHQKFVFLQHGITMNDLSGWLNRYNQNIDGFVTAAKPELISILDGNYHYAENQIWLTGFPRYDRLCHDEKKIITIMPTWRRYLMESGDATTGMWTLPKNFEQSKYYCHWDELINSECLLEALTKYGYTLQFMPHPTLQPHVNRFRRDPRVKFLSLDTSYRKVYAESNLVITDYSSAVFDFAYLRKPIVYYQFDRDEFFAGEHVFTKGYFDYERDGFGEVTYTMDDTIDIIIDYVKNDCKMKSKYCERADNFFAFNDKSNCKRVANRIIELLKE